VQGIGGLSPGKALKTMPKSLKYFGRLKAINNFGR
jgi:hypothetical protein